MFIRSYGGDMTPTAALDLAEAVVRDGFGSHRAALAALFSGARRRGVCETLVAIAADPTAPLVARQRALGRVVVAYTAIETAGDAAASDGAAPLPVQHAHTAA